MEPAELSEALRIAQAATRLGQFRAADWPDLAVALLLEGVADPEVAELAGLDRYASPWRIDPLVTSLCDKHAVAAPADSDEAVALLAGLMSEELRARPAAVTSPMIRLLARLAPPDFDSDLANQCYGAEEYLDCGCSAHVDSTWENELRALPGPRIPDTIIRELSRPLRSTLPAAQPSKGN